MTHPDQNVIQTQKCEPCQLNMTNHALSCRGLFHFPDTSLIHTPGSAWHASEQFNRRWPTGSNNRMNLTSFTHRHNEMSLAYMFPVTKIVQHVVIVILNLCCCSSRPWSVLLIKRRTRRARLGRGSSSRTRSPSFGSRSAAGWSALNRSKTFHRWDGSHYEMKVTCWFLLSVSSYVVVSGFVKRLDKAWQGCWFKFCLMMLEFVEK